MAVKLVSVYSIFKPTYFVLGELTTTLETLNSRREPGSPKLQNDLTNFLHEIAMIRDVFTILAMLVTKYDKCGSDRPLLQAGRFGQAHKLSLKQKCTWAKDDLKEAEKLGHMLAGHMANLSFAMQIINTAALTSIEKSMKRNADESEERHREMIALRINNTRKSDLEDDPKFNPYLESVIADLNSTIATNDPPDLEEGTAKHVIFQAEIDRDWSLEELRKTLEEKMESDKELSSIMQVKINSDSELSRAIQVRTKIDEDLKATIDAIETSRKRGILIAMLLFLLWNRLVPSKYMAISINFFVGC